MSQRSSRMRVKRRFRASYLLPILERICSAGVRFWDAGLGRAMPVGESDGCWMFDGQPTERAWRRTSRCAFPMSEG